jgi:hypothetical protein
MLVASILGLAAAAAPASQLADALDEGPSNWTAPAYYSLGASRAAAGREALAASPVALPFVAVAPCRLVDTRGNGAPLTGGFLPAATVRTYTLVGQCNIPADAKAISLNATAVNPVGPGFLTIWAQGAALPTVSTLNFVANTVVANAAVVPLSGTGAISVVFGVSGGDLILDTNGYYSPLGVVNSLNGQGGDLTLVAGANVTLTPGAGTLSISAANGTGPTGPAGPTGATGPTGPTGPAGSTGATGTFDTQCVLASNDWNQFRNCVLAPTIVFDSIPVPTPFNVPSQPFQAQQTAEFGDAITLAGTARKAVSVTILMSGWAKFSSYPTMSPAGFVHPVTVNLYSDNAHAVAHNPDLGSFTQNVLMSWRPEADPTCPNTGYGAGFGWRASDNACYNGYAFPITVSLGGVTLPSTFIYGIAYNTQTWGYAPIGFDGPYTSLNVGLKGTTGPPLVPGVPSIGTDNDPNAVYWNTKTASLYTDGGAGGTGTFRLDTNWAPYIPAVRFSTTN